MSRQSKMRNKRLARQRQLEGRPKNRLTPEQKRLRREQARILFEAQVAEKARRAQEDADHRQKLARKEKDKQERRRKAKERTRRQRLQNSSPTSPGLMTKAVEVRPEGTVLRLAESAVISRKGVHVKTYPASAQIKFMGDGKHAVIVIPDQPPRMLDLETGQDQVIEADAEARPVEMIIPTQTSEQGG